MGPTRPQKFLLSSVYNHIIFILFKNRFIIRRLKRPAREGGKVTDRLADDNNIINIKLYHAGDREILINDIIFPGPRGSCDFGRGFYLAESRRTAEEWVVNKKSPVVNVYNLNVPKNEILYLSGTEWLKVVVGFRENKYRVRFKSPVVCGPIANDRMNIALPLFMSGIIGDIRLLECLDYCKLGNQYLLRGSAEYLTFIESCQLRDSDLKIALDNYNGRRKNMGSELIKIQRAPVTGEKFIEDYLAEGDYIEP